MCDLPADHPIRGLQAGDPLAWQIITGRVLLDGDDQLLATTVRSTARRVGSSEVLVLAFPAGRRRALYESLDHAETRRALLRVKVDG